MPRLRTGIQSIERCAVSAAFGKFQYFICTEIGIVCIYCISCIDFGAAHELVQQDLQFLCAVAKHIIFASMTCQRHILFCRSGYIHLNASLVVHNIIALAVILKSVSPEQDVQSISAGTEFGIAVHQ